MSSDHGISILLIDGDDNSRTYFAERLKQCSSDYIIFQAASGKTGRQIYESVSVDCVVLELELPDTSGFELLIEFVPVATRPEVAVVVLTRLTSLSLLNIALKNGAQAVLQKAMISGDILDKAILKAISNVTAEKGKQP
jgi:DNA-binding NarL/FixJ family response regulator